MCKSLAKKLKFTSLKVKFRTNHNLKKLICSKLQAQNSSLVKIRKKTQTKNLNFVKSKIEKLKIGTNHNLKNLLLVKSQVKKL